jgi:hypothetical protein
MMFTCPLMNLPCETTARDIDEVDKYRSTGRIYFNTTHILDYFNYFLDRGKHSATIAEEVVDFERGNCNWVVGGRRYHWPLVRSDCVLGYDAIEDRAIAEDLGDSLDALKGAIRNYHNNADTITRTGALLYALSIMSGDGTAANAGPTLYGCDFPAGGTELGIKFGAYYSTNY